MNLKSVFLLSCTALAAAGCVDPGYEARHGGYYGGQNAYYGGGYSGGGYNNAGYNAGYNGGVYYGGGTYVVAPGQRHEAREERREERREQRRNAEGRHRDDDGRRVWRE